MKKLFFTILLAAFAVSSFAQGVDRYDESQGTFERITKRGPYLTNRFLDNWYLSAAGGLNLYVGDGDSKGSFGKRLAPALDISLGKWFTPSVGIRFQYNGLQAKGWSSHITPFTNRVRNSDNVYQKKFNVYNIHMDFMWNASHAIGGFKETRLWNFVPFVGFGYARSSKSSGGHSNQLGATLGLLNNIRLSEVIDLNLEYKCLFVGSDFDLWGRGTSAKIDAMMSLTAGITVKFGPRGGFKRPVPPVAPNYTPYEQRISMLENELSGSRAMINNLNRELEAARNRPLPVPEPVMNPSTTIFFTIGSAVISDKEMVNVEHYSRFIKAHPNNSFQVTGYADSATGSTRRNQELSEQRANAVADALVNRFGVNRSQLKVEGKGETDKFGAPALCRIVIID